MITYFFAERETVKLSAMIINKKSINNAVLKHNFGSLLKTRYQEKWVTEGLFLFLFLKIKTVAKTVALNQGNWKKK